MLGAEIDRRIQCLSRAASPQNQFIPIAFTVKQGMLKKRVRNDSSLTPGNRLAAYLTDKLAQDVRAIVPGHLQRGGDPTSTDRLLCSRFGAMAGELVEKGLYGNMTALKGAEIVAVPLSEVAGKLKTIPPDSQFIRQAKLLGISMGD